MTSENAKSLMKVMYNHITSHPHHISQSHQVIDDCNRDTNADHNTDGQVHPHVIWVNELTIQHHTICITNP